MSAPASTDRWPTPMPVPITVSRDGHWDGLLILAAAYILFSIGRIHDFVPGLALLRPALIVGALVIAAWLIDPRRSRRLAPALRERPTQFLLALVCWMALSVPGALWPGGAFNTLVSFLKVALTFVVLASGARGWRDVERLAGTYFAAAAAQAAFRLWHFTPAHPAAGQTPVAELASAAARRWYYDSNDLATLLVTALPLGVYFLVTRRPLAQRFAAAFGMAPLLMYFARSESRGAFVALVAVGLYLVVRMGTIPLRWRIGGVSGITILFLLTLPESYRKDLGTVTQRDYNYTSDEGRLRVWRRGLGYLVSRPVLGVGAGNFRVAEGMISPLAERSRLGRPVRWMAPHNIFVQVGAELGLPGLVFFVALLASTFAALSRARRSPGARAPPALAQSLTAALIGFLVGGLFLSLAYHELFYTLAALAVGLSKRRRLRLVYACRPFARERVAVEPTGPAPGGIPSSTGRAGAPGAAGTARPPVTIWPVPHRPAAGPLGEGRSRS